MTVEDLRHQHESKPRNKLVADAFFLIKYIEQFGTGIQRILDDCHAQQLPEPDFQVQGHTFRAVFKPGAVSGRKPSASELNERQKRAVEKIRQMDRITRAEYEKLAGVSRATAKRDLENLKKAGILVQRESGPAAYYELCDRLKKAREPA